MSAPGEVESGPAGPLEAVRDDDPLLMVFTLGTAGGPKAVVLSHANCFWTNLSLSLVAPVHADDVVLAMLPQFHVGVWNVQPLQAWWTGATVVLERKFDVGRALDLIVRHRVTTMMGVPANYQFLAAHDGFASTDLDSLRLAVVGGAPMSEALLHTWHDHGPALVQGYGLTEAAPNVLCVPGPMARAKIGDAGLPYPYVDVRVADPDTGAVLDGPAEGELLVRSRRVRGPLA